MTGILLGTIPLFKDALINKFDCASIAFFRVVVAFISISALVVFTSLRCGKRGCFLISKKHIGSFIGYGAVCIAAVNYLYLKSLTCTSAAVALVTVFVSAPLTTMLANLIRRNSQKNLKEILCVLAMVCGCLLVNMNAETTASLSHWKGIVYAAFAGACYGMYGIFGSNLAEDYDYPIMMFWQFAIASLATLILVFIQGTNVLETMRSIGSINFREGFSIVEIGTVSTFIPYLLYSMGLKKGVSPTTASALTLLEPVAGTLLAFLFLNEAISITQGIGMSLVIMFSYISYQLSIGKNKIPSYEQA